MSARDKEITAFIGSIVSEREKGYGFLPLIGAGASVASGIPAINQLKRYLAYCIAISLDLATDELLSKQPNVTMLTPRSFKTSPWPRLSDLGRVNQTRFPSVLLSNLVQVIGEANPQRISQASRAAYQEAIGALADWRSSLLFLSRLSVTKDIACCGAPDDQITDSFFLHMVEKARPNLAHHMLAQLASLLGFGTILTVNFDELLERAFAAANDPLTVFDVHLNAGFPSARSVCSERSIVKLHGGRYGLRANYSLDMPPSIDDERHFAGYLRGRHISLDEWRAQSGKRQFETNHHLLLAGISASDARTQALLRTTLSRTDAHLYWITFFPNEQADICNVFSDFKSRLHIVRHSNYGLLFLQMYQCLAKCLPPTGIDFPALWQLPCPPRPLPQIATGAELHGTGEFTTIKGNLQKELETGSADSNDGRPYLLVVHSKAHVVGVTSLLSGIYLDNDTQLNLVWLDLDDCMDADELFIRLTTAVARKAGVPDLLPYALNYDAASRRKELFRYMSGAGGRWIVFLNGRDGCGDNIEKPWSDVSLKQFWTMVSDLTSDSDACSQLPRPNLTIVVLCYSDLLTGEYHALHAAASGPRRSFEVKASCVTFDKNKAITEACRIAFSSPHESGSINIQRFVYALLLFRRIRYPAVMASWIVRGTGESKCDRDISRYKLASEWLAELEAVGVVQMKEGGFAGIHRELRVDLKQRLEGLNPDLKWHAPELHECIADWYYKLFLSSDDPMALFESVHHRCRCVEAVKSLLGLGTPGPEAVVANTSESLNALVTSALQEAVNSLRISRDVVLSRGYSESIFQCLGQLETTVESISDPVMRETLKERCSKLRFDVAVEVAEYDVAARELPNAASHEAAAVRAPDLCDDPSKEPFTLPDGTQTGRNGGRAQLSYESLERARVLIGVRAYDCAKSHLCSRLSAIKFPFPELADGKEPTTRQIRRSAIIWANTPRSSCPRAVRLLRRLMYVYIAMGRSVLLAQRGTAAGESQQLYRYAIRLYHCATEVLRFVADDGSGFLQVEHAHLRTQLAIALANTDRHSEAHRRLMEARAFLSSIPAPRHAIREAVIDLRISETYLIRAARNLNFAATRQIAGSDKDGAFGVGTVGAGLNEGYIRSLLNSALYCLGRAEGRLSGQRKNVRWWMKAYELRTKHHEFRLVLAYGDDKGARTGESFFDIAKSSVKSLEEVLSDAVRIVRIDCFQLARLVESLTTQYCIFKKYVEREYPRAVAGTTVKVAPGEITECLQSYQLLCERGVSELERSFKAREEFRPEGDYVLNPNVKSYTEQVIAESGRLYRAAAHEAQAQAH